MPRAGCQDRSAVRTAFYWLDFYLVSISLPTDSTLAAFYAVKSVAAINAASPKAYVTMTFSLFSIACLVMATTRIRWRSWQGGGIRRMSLPSRIGSHSGAWMVSDRLASGSRILFVVTISFLALMWVRQHCGARAFTPAILVAGAIAALRPAAGPINMSCRDLARHQATE